MSDGATVLRDAYLVCLVSLLLYGCYPPLISNQTFEQCCHFCLYSDCWSQQKSILASIVPRRAIKDGVEPFVASIHCLLRGTGCNLRKLPSLALCSFYFSARRVKTTRHPSPLLLPATKIVQVSELRHQCRNTYSNRTTESENTNLLLCAL